MVKQPNIIFMMTDDQRYDTFGFKSDGVVITPHLDKMASEGVCFNQAYHVSPICMPSRAAVHMSKYISDHQCGFDVPTDKTVTRQEFMESYPVLLREAGYYTGFIGKFGYAVTDEKKTNAEKVLGKRIHADGYVRTNAQEDLEENMPKDLFDEWYGNTGQGRYFPLEDGTFNGHANPYDAKHLTAFNGCKAVDFIKRASQTGKPFNLSISFKGPHNPLTPEQRHLDKYQNVQVPRQYNDTPEHFNLLPEVVRKKSRNPEYYFNRGEWKNFGAGTWEIEENYQTDIKKYYALITGVDEVVGKIRDTLEELGIADHTIVIYTSDNGMFCGSRQIHGKSILYEESIKAPMIVHDPRLDKSRQHVAVDGLISHVDIAPTILDYAGIEPYPAYRGVSFKGLVDGERDEIHDYVYGENNFNNNFLAKNEVKDPSRYQSIRSKYVRGRRYKYIRYYECEPVIEELFDVLDDPYEEHNLIGKDAYGDTHALLADKLEQFIGRVCHE
ncbi:sulfatase-like hydrolase/transferase [Vallitalea pronyensis]|uniref:Sulfatase-like hydrolase/transferase n=1 Tax=Vallitalea pronyensis TaxID=1348613 RepID=A0A8J8MIA4_9FIRM|nr:sulfatase-like hydrolase/transferase [Vallitalea pronyensis]QUI22134.1 sulfatase-like hydrolase/transferase [Vallitalea pronyensis]